MLIEGCYYIDLKKLVRISKSEKISKWKALDREKLLLQLVAPYDDVYVEIKYTQNKFGNRAWLVCPKCLKRYTRLYSVDRKLQCRKCHNLKYSSCNRRREKFYENYVKQRRRFDNLVEILSGKMRKEKRERLSKEFNQLFEYLNDYLDSTKRTGDRMKNIENIRSKIGEYKPFHN